METHRKLTILGVILLVATITIYHYHEADHPEEGFNYAYVTGIAMIVVFMASLAMINKDRFKKRKSKK